MNERLLGRYRVGELLGRGAFATVHAAHDEQLDDRVAIKILAHNHAADPDMRARFVAEGQVLRRLHSPHLIRVHDLAETDDGRPFLVLELCDRGTLRQRITDARARGWLPADADAVALAVPLAAAISAMDQAGVVHRDLTPANVLLTTAPPHGGYDALGSGLIAAGERLVVTDLGFCKDLAASTGITASGGTDGFRPPEQRAVGGIVDVRSDLWAASAILATSMTGQPALTASTATDALVKAGLSRPLARAVAKGLEADPGRRYQTPEDWLAAITRSATTDPAHTGPMATRATGEDDVQTAVAEGRPQTTGRVSRATMAGMAAAMILLVLLANSIAGAVRSHLGAGDTGDVDAAVGDQDLSGLSLADVDDMAAAPQDESSVAVTATPTPTPTPTPTRSGPPPGFEDRHGGTWRFHLTTRDGWEYDVEAVIDVAYQFGKSTEDSPPGRARFTSAVHGGSTATFTPTTIEGRSAPEVDGHQMTAHLGGFDTDEPIGADPCTSDVPFSTAAREGPRAFTCQLDYWTTQTGEPYVSLVEHDEDAIDAFLAALDGVTPQHYGMSLPDRCSVWLLPDGQVMRSPDEPHARGCTISGDGVVPDPSEAPS